MVPLEEQDRGLWNEVQVAEGIELVEGALSRHEVGPYQLQAAIVAVHAEARTAADTDWNQIAALYRELAKVQPSTAVALNHAVAVAMSEGIERGLALIDTVGSSEGLDSYYMYHAARADLLRRLCRRSEALNAYQRALSLTANAVERRYLHRRISEVQETTSQ